MNTAKMIAISCLCAAAAPIGLGTPQALAAQRYAYTGTSLFGSYEVGHKGADDKASGDFSAELELDSGEMCYFLEVEGLDEVTGAHLHKAGKGKNGPPVITLQLASDDVCITVDPELLRHIAKNEDQYYVNVHTRAFPEGAIRGQLDQS